MAGFWWVMIYAVSGLPVLFLKYCLASVKNLSVGYLLFDWLIWPTNLPVIAFLLARRARKEKTTIKDPDYD